MFRKILLATTLVGMATSVHAASNRPKDFKTICKTGQTCSVSGSTQVAFGASGKFVYKTLSGTFKCDVSTFGSDPNSAKKKKECSISKKSSGASSSSSSNSSSSSKNNSSNNSKNNSNNNSSSNNSSSSSSGGNSSSRKSGCGSSPKGTVKISSTMRITGSFDGGCKEYVATFGDGSQKEGQDPVFRLTGGSMKNVFVGPNGDGIHVYGGGNLTNITWRNVAEDALTVKGAGNVSISNFEAYGASDKVFQLNAKTTFKASNCTVKDMGKMFRENGGKCYPVSVTVNNCSLTNASDAIFRSDCKSSSFKLSNSNVSGAKVCYQGTANCG